MLFLLVYAALFGLYYLLAGRTKHREKVGDELAPEGHMQRNRAGATIPILYGRAQLSGIYIDASMSSWREHRHEEEIEGGGGK
ncbi:hypothetical protein DRO31_05630 [Candidatus Bathyarchaeota archaeon]|nr:MAG: hypothetical protein DRO31_05630 [Candidatus Bathyarchaeota archaeon]